MDINMNNINTIYICGPMTGKEKFNFPAFFDMEKVLNEAGYETENPADNDGPTAAISLKNALKKSGTWEEYMRRDIPRVLKCDAVVVLPGWRLSRGACWEVDIARKLKMPVYRWDEGLKPLIDIVSLSGYATVGKDECAKQLEPYGWERLSFADTIRDCLYALNPAVELYKDFYEDSFNDFYRFKRIKEIVDKYGWDKVKNNKLEVRHLLQRLGTEVGRDILGENIWVDATFAKMQDGKKYVITDARFPNELAACKLYNATTIWVERPGVGPINNHASDNALSAKDCDTTLHNSGDKKQLGYHLLRILNER